MVLMGLRQDVAMASTLGFVFRTRLARPSFRPSCQQSLLCCSTSVSTASVQTVEHGITCITHYQPRVRLCWWHRTPSISLDSTPYCTVGTHDTGDRFIILVILIPYHHRRRQPLDSSQARNRTWMEDTLPRYRRTLAPDPS